MMYVHTNCIFFLVDVNMQSCQHQLLWRKGERPERSLKGTNLILIEEKTVETSDVVVEDPFKQFNKSKREEASEKISERHLMGQLTQNPFLLNSDYVADLMVQDSFLKPQNTAQKQTP